MWDDAAGCGAMERRNIGTRCKGTVEDVRGWGKVARLASLLIRVCVKSYPPAMGGDGGSEWGGIGGGD